MGVQIATAPVVSVRSGRLVGAMVEGVHAFRGIPFASPPFGADHLRAPRPVEPWTGVREALVDGAKPPQPKFPGTENAPAPWDRAPVGEDCLNLNIWTPELGDARLPVLVWITGGSFRAGSNAWYDGRRFARDGVVCVAINYRSGPEGFLYIRDGTPNRGLLDQIAALEWVRDNIAAFGGDPDNVTVCGESAGAMSIGVLVSMPRAVGLFRRAVMQSGAAHFAISRESAIRVGEAFAAKLGVAPTHEAMAAMPYERLIAAHGAIDADVLAHPEPRPFGISIAGAVLTQPVVDGDVVPDAPIDRIRAGCASGIDVIVGSNVDDWRLFLAFEGKLGQITEQMLLAPIETSGPFSLAAYGLPVERTLTAYRDAYPGATPGELLAAVQTDWWIRVPALRLADAHISGRSRTYMYEFAWKTPVAGGMFGACHALEIPFVFDTLDLGPSQMLGEFLVDAPQTIATAMHAAWVSFVRTGDAGWPAYEASRRATMRFDTPSRVLDDPRARERDLWEGVR